MTIAKTKYGDTGKEVQARLTVTRVVRTPDSCAARALLAQRGFTEGNTSKPGDFVIERAFAEQ